jgi:polyhydroxyalkanoate synthesis repressor PhaR
MGETRVIKRYANRKLYDTQRSRYVTLDQIAEMIRGGEDVRIVDNNSKEDLTTITLAQIIFEEEKKQKSFLPLNAMRNIIQSGGERIEELVSQAQKKMSGVFQRKPTASGAPDGKPEPELPPEILAVSAANATNSEHKEREVTRFREWIDEWQHKVDERIRHVVEGISPLSSLQKEVSALTLRLAELEKKIEKLSNGEDKAV